MSEETLDDLVKQTKKEEHQANKKNNNNNNRKGGPRRGDGNRRGGNGPRRGGNRNDRDRRGPRQQNRGQKFLRKTGGFQRQNRDRFQAPPPIRRNREQSPPPAPRARDPFQDGVVMEIHNLSPQILEDELYNLVTRYGAVEACKIERDSKGRSMERATVVFRDKLSYDEARKELHRCELEGRTISIELVKKGPTPSPIIRQDRGEDNDRRRDDFRREPIRKRNGFHNRDRFGGGRRRNFGGRRSGDRW